MGSRLFLPLRAKLGAWRYFLPFALQMSHGRTKRLCQGIGFGFAAAKSVGRDRGRGEEGFARKLKQKSEQIDKNSIVDKDNIFSA